MNALDLSLIYAKYERRTGAAIVLSPSCSDAIIALWLLHRHEQLPEVEKATYDNVAFRYLAADQHPDHDTLASFWQEHLDARRACSCKR